MSLAAVTTMMPLAKAGLAPLVAGAGQAATKAAEVAKDFESVLVGQMLKESRQTLDKEDGGLFAGDKTDSLGALFDLYMGKHLAESGTIGVADSIARNLTTDRAK